MRTLPETAPQPHPPIVSTLCEVEACSRSAHFAGPAADPDSAGTQLAPRSRAMAAHHCGTVISLSHTSGMFLHGRRRAGTKKAGPYWKPERGKYGAKDEVTEGPNTMLCFLFFPSPLPFSVFFSSEELFNRGKQRHCCLVWCEGWGVNHDWGVCVCV